MRTNFHRTICTRCLVWGVTDIQEWHRNAFRRPCLRNKKKPRRLYTTPFLDKQNLGPYLKIHHSNGLADGTMITKCCLYMHQQTELPIILTEARCVLSFVAFVAFQRATFLAKWCETKKRDLRPKCDWPAPLKPSNFRFIAGRAFSRSCTVLKMIERLSSPSKYSTSRPLLPL